ncbi:hypothetical protein PC123_g16544 [Phytophthora cactorum]|nr:hypothetical protein PC123_g16544 [Phytophthora cactorum]
MNEDNEIIPAPGLIDVRGHGPVVEDDDRENVADLEYETPNTEQSEKVVEPIVCSSVDEFGLKMLRFIAEQKRTPRMIALIGFLESDALPLDAQLRVKALQMAPHYVVRNGVLVRRVHLRA